MVRTCPKGTEALNLGAPTLLAYLSFVGLVAPNLEHLRPLGGRARPLWISRAHPHSLLTKAPGELVMFAGRLAVCGFWDMRP